MKRHTRSEARADAAAMVIESVSLVTVESPEQRDAARALVSEYLRWVAEVARSNYGLSFDVEAMIESDFDDSKFFPPRGRFYLVRYEAAFIGVGCLKRLAPGLGEIQRMYVRPEARGIGAGRLLVERLLEDARSLGYLTVRLESLRALGPAHELYRSVGFVEIAPYNDNSMQAYQTRESLPAYSDSAVFMEARLAAGPA
ncbi:MAG TPA: GNAT family N-acetyltransferase [Casimicrobiaceae bacterium]|nr:GNAT family N-acetyltransferase [Casimicrobiaceae bacterium]